MPVAHKVLDTYPIIITVMNGTITFEDVLSNCKLVDTYLKRRRLFKVYWVMDASNIDYSRETAIQIAEATKNGLAGSGGDPRVVPLVIMPPENYAPVEKELNNRYFTLRYPLFPTIYDAYTFAVFLSQSTRHT